MVTTKDTSFNDSDAGTDDWTINTLDSLSLEEPTPESPEAPLPLENYPPVTEAPTKACLKNNVFTLANGERRCQALVGLGKQCPRAAQRIRCLCSAHAVRYAMSAKTTDRARIEHYYIPIENDEEKLSALSRLPKKATTQAVVFCDNTTSRSVFDALQPSSLKKVVQPRAYRDELCTAKSCFLVTTDSRSRPPFYAPLVSMVINYDVDSDHYFRRIQKSGHHSPRYVVSFVSCEDAWILQQIERESKIKMVETTMDHVLSLL